MGVALDDAFVLLEENVLQSVVQIISSFLSNQQLQQNSASSESSHYNASSSSSPRSILTRHQHLVLSILSKSFVAFSLECYVKQPGVIVRLNNIINTPLGVYTKDIQTSNVDLKFGIGSCKLSFWNVFGGIPDGFAFPLKYDMQCRYLYVHAEKSILKTLSAVEKEFEDIIEEPEWLLACNGDIVVGRSLILQETSSRANSSDMIDLLASNALTGGDSNIRDSGGIYSSNNATIAAYHRLALAINTNIFVGELAINCSRLSFSLISINYASVFEKIGTCLKQLQQLQKVSPHKRRFVKTKYDVSSESAVLPMDINFSLAVVKT